LVGESGLHLIILTLITDRKKIWRNKNTKNLKGKRLVTIIHKQRLLDMDKPRRLFDCIELQLSRFPKEDMMAAKINGSWKTYSTQEVKDNVNSLSAGLLQRV
jgi:hypothetical protein